MWTGWPHPSSRAGSPRPPALTTRLPAGPCLSTSHSRSLCPNLAGAGVGRGPWRGAALWLHVTVAAKVSPAHKCGPRWAAAELQAQRVLHRSSRLREFSKLLRAQSSPPSSQAHEAHRLPNASGPGGWTTGKTRPKSCLWELGPALALPSSLPQDLGAHQASVPTSPAARHETLPQDGPPPGAEELALRRAARRTARRSFFLCIYFFEGLA